MNKNKHKVRTKKDFPWLGAGNLFIPETQPYSEKVAKMIWSVVNNKKRLFYNKKRNASKIDWKFIGDMILIGLGAVWCLFGTVLAIVFIYKKLF